MRNQTRATAPVQKVISDDKKEKMKAYLLDVLRVQDKVAFIRRSA